MTMTDHSRAVQPVKSRIVRVFVSSTFRDMGPERDELVKRVFPQLRKLCEQRGVAWGEVDLRWGVTDEESAEGQVLPICLEEIRRCRPYFIGLLGERYGWIPGEFPAELVEQVPWLAQHRDHSVTELEILHGVLNDPEMADHAFFYFRSRAYIDSLPTEEQPWYREPTPEEIEKLGAAEAQRRAREKRRKLENLKEHIRASGLPVREGYFTPEALGEMVLADLTAVIDRLYPEGTQPDPLDREAAEQDAFARSRAEVYIGGEKYFERLNAYVQGDGPPLVVLGESGSGKSALLANWALRYRDAHPEDLMIMHFIGASQFNTDLKVMLWRIMSELKRHFGIPIEIPDEVDALQAAFANWLHMAAARGRVILILDALDQLEDRRGAPDLLWLPLQVPPNLRMVLSTLPGRPLEALRTRGWPTIQVELLKPNERERLIVEYLAQYSKSLSSAQVERIVTVQHTANPLYIRALLEELRVFGEHYQLDARIDYYLAATTIPALYTKILERYESDYERDRPGLVRKTMSLLWGARRGLSEPELMDLLGRDGEPLPGKYWSPLYLAADKSLVSRSGLIGLSHDYLRQAVCHRYLPSERDRHHTHLKLAEYFENHQAGDRMLDEMLWQLRKAGALERLTEKLQDLHVVKAAMERNRYEVFDHYRAVEAGGSVNRSVLLSPIIESPADHLEYVEVASLLLANDRQHSIALDMLKKAQEHCLQRGQRSILADFLGYEFRVRQDAIRVDPEGKLAKTPVDALERKISLQRDLGMTEAVVSSLEEMSLIELNRKMSLRALELLREAEKIARDAGHIYDRLRLLSRQSGIFWDRGDVLAALHLHSLSFTSAVEEDNRDALSDLCLQAGGYALVLGDDRADLYFANSIRFLNEVGNIEEAASRLRTIGALYLRLGKGKQHNRLGLNLLKEARRLYSVLGSQKEAVSSLGLQILKETLSEGDPDEEQQPSAEGLWPASMAWPLSPLAPSKGDPGKRCTWWMVSSDTIEACKRSTSSCFEVLGGGEKVVERFDVEHAWEAILYLLSGYRRMPSQKRPTTPSKEDALYHIAMLGNWELNDAFDLGSGIYQYLTHSEVKAIRQGFVRASRCYSVLAANYNAYDMDLLAVYPGGWEEMGDTGRAYVAQQFDRLLAFFTRASKLKKYIICGIWGPECNEAVRHVTRQGKEMAEVTRRQNQQVKSNKRKRTSPGRASSTWYRVTGGAGGTIDFECKHCDYGTFIEARHGEVMPSRCPKCGAE